jgi:hypothetical protein
LLLRARRSNSLFPLQQKTHLERSGGRHTCRTFVAGDSGISFQKLVRDGDDPEKFVVFGQKLRRRTLKLSDTVEGSVSCELPIRGRHKLEREGEVLCNYPLLERAYAQSAFFTQAICSGQLSMSDKHASWLIWKAVFLALRLTLQHHVANCTQVAQSSPSVWSVKSTGPMRVIMCVFASGS